MIIHTVGVRLERSIHSSVGTVVIVAGEPRFDLDRYELASRRLGVDTDEIDVRRQPHPRTTDSQLRRDRRQSQLVKRLPTCSRVWRYPLDVFLRSEWNDRLGPLASMRLVVEVEMM